MFLKRVQTFLVLLMAAIGAQFLPSNSHAQLGLNQERISESEWSRGFHGFNMIADGNGLERISLDQFRSSASADVLLIVIGGLRDLPFNVTNHVANGGAALIASDSSNPFREVSFAGFRFDKLRAYRTEEDESFGGMPDCPIISDFKDHPIVSGVKNIATNRPGYIWATQRTAVGLLPSSYRRRSSGYFIGANENKNGGRVVAVGDQSIFTNQMLIYKNNALFANQTLNWLKNGQPKKMLIVVDGSEYSTLDPSDVLVDVPAPSQEEVLDALQNLPPSAMLDFANSVATVVEDENMVNDLLHNVVDEVPDLAFNRFYVFLIFAVACFSFVAAFVCQRKLQSQTGAEIAFKNSQSEQAELKKIQSRERQQAAFMLLDRFCVDLAGRRFSDWPSFPTGFKVDEDRSSEKLFKSMTHMSVLYKSKPASFWTRKKLVQLENKVLQWRGYFEGRPELVDDEVALNKNHWSNQTIEEVI